VIGQLANLMLGRVFVPKYLDPRSPAVDVYINKSVNQYTLIYIVSSINVMEKDIILGLYLQGLLRHTLIVLQLVDISIVSPKGVLDDVMVSIDSWEYPNNFIFIQTKYKLNGYPLIL
jgi:hypothetical protein